MLQVLIILTSDTTVGLNPFEVREVLQVAGSANSAATSRLNPFEVREVLQEYTITNMLPKQSQSL